MKYRKNQRTGDKISEIGIGSAYLPESEHSTAVEGVRFAFENGVNYFDLAAGDGKAFPIFKDALADVRGQVLYQIHFGADYSKGTYGWTLDLDRVKRSVEWQLEQLGTDYIDYGFIHCQDEQSDWDTYQKNGILQYLQELRSAGVVKHIGMSSHTPAVIQTILDTGIVDMLMFSVNPSYDCQMGGEFAKGSVDERAAVYRRCETEGVGISVMKPFCGGQLLDAKTSAFGSALTIYQCMKYALDRPGVLTVLPGIRDKADVEKLLAYYDRSEEELDYSVIGTFAPADANGKCVYCNHCKPCPAGLDVGLINKYYDLAKAGDGLAVQHYKALEKNASDCIACGHCDRRCPFHVNQSGRMKEIAAYFG